MRPFIVCIHDATPAYVRQMRVLLRDLAPILGRRIAFGVVPNWHGEWPLAARPYFCQLLLEHSEERLLHGCFHRRQRGWSPVSWLAEHSDEMDGLTRDETRRTIELGQQVFADAFGERARGFLAPAWQIGHARPGEGNDLRYVLGFFALQPAGLNASSSVRPPAVPLTTFTWDCGRWDWLGHVGHRIGALLQSRHRVPVLAIHPRDLDRGFRPAILRVIHDLIDAGFTPSTPFALLADTYARVAA